MDQKDQFRGCLLGLAVGDAVFRDGLLKAVNLGDDADTTGVIYGQFAGSYFGEGAIATSW